MSSSDSSAPRDPLLRRDAPQLRTATAIVEKSEQIVDALERGAITPKTAEQITQGLKTIMGLEKLGLQYVQLVLRMGKKAVVPRTPILRNLLGLPEQVSPGDGEAVRALLPDAK